MNKFCQSFWPLGLSLLTISVVWPLNPAPIPSAYAEGFAMAGGLVLFAGVLLRKEAARLPWLSVLFLLFALLVFVQSKLLDYPFASLPLQPIVFLLWVAVLGFAGAHYKAMLGSAKYYSGLAWAVGTGGLLAALMGWAGLFGMRLQFGMRLYEIFDGNVLRGPMMQPNHFATTLVVGMLCLAYLGAEWRHRLKLLPSLALVMGFPLALTASRTGLLETCVLLLLACCGRLVFGRRLEEKFKAFLENILLVFAVCLLLQFLAPYLMALGGEKPISVATRLGQETSDSGFAIRFEVWLRAWKIFSAHPVLGVGMGNYAWFDFLERAAQPEAYHAYRTTFTHSHNMLLQLMAETGVVGVVLACIGIWRWLLSWHGVVSNSGRLLSQLLAFLLLMHSMLEYPLWYSYFLGLFVLCAVEWGEFDVPAQYQRVIRGGAAIFALVILVWGVIFLTGISKVDRVMELSVAGQQKEAAQLAVDVLNGNGIVAPYAAFRVVDMAAPGQDAAANQLYVELSDKLVRWRPFGTVVYKHGLWLISIGEEEKARLILQQGVAVYPGLADAYLQMMHEEAKDPYFSSVVDRFEVILNEVRKTTRVSREP